MQRQANNPKQAQNPLPFKLFKNDLEDLFLTLRKLPRSLVADLVKWSDMRSFKGFLYKNIYNWFYEVKERIAESAAIAPKIIDNLLVEKVPYVVIEIYLEVLNKNKPSLDKQLNLKDAEEIFKYVPSELIMDYLDLYPIKLTDKEKDNLIYELVDSKRKINKKVDRLPAIFKDRKKYAQILVEELMRNNHYDLAGSVIKKYSLARKDYEEVQIKLIENSARSMPHWQKEKFSWDMLEEVFNNYPSAIAACIKNIYRQKKPSKDMEKGFASIVSRIPEVIKYLPNDIKNRLKETKDLPKNNLQNNKFVPSNAEKYFSLSDFGVHEKDVIIVDDLNLQTAISQVFQSPVIGIDTESTVARTTLSTSYDLLAIVQISTGNKVFIFDAKLLKDNHMKSQIVNEFFRSEKNTVVGHTLEADLNEDVTKLFGFNEKVKCQKIDICPIFKKAFPGKRAGLAYISQAILGKQICKEYTLTNWDRRPLLKNQIHYAALDALIVLKIWDLLKDIKPAHHQPKIEENKQEKPEYELPQEEDEQKEEKESKDVDE